MGNVIQLKKLKEQISSCKLCELWKGRKNAVFGEGNENAEIMIIGLGPGREEDKTGRPFVGAAGRFLNELLAYAGLKREELYITNVVKCIPPNNNPSEEQIKVCMHAYLEKEIEIVNPRIIIPLGKIACSFALCEIFTKLPPMHKICGKVFRTKLCGNIREIVPMYHPAAILRNPALKEEAVSHWKQLKNILKNQKNSKSLLDFYLLFFFLFCISFL